MTGKAGRTGGSRSGAGRPLGATAELKRKDVQELLPAALENLKLALEKKEAWATRLVVDKCIPALKPSTGFVQAGLFNGKTMANKAASIVDAVENGKMTPTVAAEIMASIGQHTRIVEVSELIQRLEQLEAQQVRKVA